MLNSNIDFFEDDDSNPMDGVSNMSDAMLVLAVGMMLAVVINWKVDLKEVYDKSMNQTVKLDENQMTEIETEEQRQVSDISFEDLESKYKKSGTVYTDIYSGKTYVVIEE